MSNRIDELNQEILAVLDNPAQHQLGLLPVVVTAIQKCEAIERELLEQADMRNDKLVNKYIEAVAHASGQAKSMGLDWS